MSPGAPDHQIQQDLIDLTAAAQLTQIHDEPTRGDNTLDLVFTTNPSLLKSTASVPGISDHEAVVTQPQRVRSKPRRRYSYSRAKTNKTTTTTTTTTTTKKKGGGGGVETECRDRKYYRENIENGRGRNQHRHHVERVQDAATLCHSRKRPLTHSTEKQALPIDQQRDQTPAQEKENTV